MWQGLKSQKSTSQMNTAKPLIYHNLPMWVRAIISVVGYIRLWIDSILEDLRKAHIGRSDGAQKFTIVEELKRDLEEVVKFEDSHTEQLLLVFYKQTKLRYSKLSEKQWLIRIMQKIGINKECCF